VKWICLLLMWPLWPFLIEAQKSAFFETTFFFKDSTGNQDSIVIGHDIAANAYYNPQFGEVNISSPWNSVFEVRAAHFLDWNQMNENLVLSKKIVADNESGFHPDYDCLWFNEAIIFFVRVINLPITIYWNRDDFEDSYCRNRSTLTPNVFPMIVAEWWPDLEEDYDYVCLAQRDSFIVSSFNTNFSFFRIDSVEGGIIDTIFPLLLVPRDQIAFDSPCSSTVSAVHLNQNSEIKLYPNPTSDFVIIPDGDNLNWSVIDPVCQLFKQGKGSLIDFSDFGKGIHFISIFNDNGILVYTGKIVKL